jgi:nucleotide-binding universal stress UspA family protein
MKILVPLDGSRTAEAAVPVAARLASKRGAQLVLLSVATLHARHEPVPAEVEIAPVQDARSYLHEARQRLAPDADVVTAVWIGAPAAAIIRAAHTYGVEMIVMTTHGRSGREREMFGSVADAILRDAPMLVLVLRPDREATSRRPPAERAAV